VVVVAAVTAVVEAVAVAVLWLSFLPVCCELMSGPKGAKHIKHTRRAVGGPIEEQCDSNGGGGGGGVNLGGYMGGGGGGGGGEILIYG